MPLLTFPPAPVNGQLYPATPLPGQTQYEWSATNDTWIQLGVATTVIPGTYGDSANIGQFAVDAQGRITFAANCSIGGCYIKTNSLSAYNNYVWPASDGAVNTALTTDGSGGLSWSPVPLNNITCSTINAKGTLIVGAAPSIPSSLNVGANGQTLTACSTCALGVYWNTPNTSIYIPCSAIFGKGSILAGSAPSTPVSLSPGLNGQVLVACAGCSTGLTWVDSTLFPAGIPRSVITSKGVLITGSAPGQPVALPVGSNGYFLTACSTPSTGLTWSLGCQGTVTEINTGYGLTGGPLTTTGVISLCSTCVINPNIIAGKGTLLVGTSANTPSSLPLGANGQLLTACPTSSLGVAWSTITYPYICCSILTGHGAILTASSAGNPIALPVSPDGYILQACSACVSGLSWNPVDSLGVPVFAPVVPTNQTSIGTYGEIAVDSNYFYWHDGTNWQRVAADAGPW